MSALPPCAPLCPWSPLNGTVNDQRHDIENLEREFLGYAIAQTHPKIREWRGEHFESDMREANAAVLRTITDDAAAQRVAEIMHVLALPAARFKGRVLNVGELRFIAHIDFPNASGDFPFVKVKCANVPPGSIADWHPLAAVIARAFDEFRPRALYVFHPSHCRCEHQSRASTCTFSLRPPGAWPSGRTRLVSIGLNCGAAQTSTSIRGTRPLMSRCLESARISEAR